MRSSSWMVATLALFTASSTTAQPAWRDPSPHAVRLVTVAPDVRLEVLDWGGAGRPVVLLAGLGNTAHVFARANHYVFLSNEADVLRELRAFIALLR